jgi:hypothetical protein
MRLSDIKLENGTIRSRWSVARETLVETPNSDGYAVLTTERSMEDFLRENGDVEVVYDPKVNVYRVPAFAEARKLYSDAKNWDCVRWGCE